MHNRSSSQFSDMMSIATSEHMTAQVQSVDGIRHLIVARPGFVVIVNEDTGATFIGSVLTRTRSTLYLLEVPEAKDGTEPMYVVDFIDVDGISILTN